MHALLVVAHPLDDSFTKAAARRIEATLLHRDIEVDVLDLYAEGFDPCLTAAERRSYFTASYDSSGVAPYVERLRRAEKLVLVFPQWWFGVPAILKGFFDRVLVPGVAFEQPPRMPSASTGSDGDSRSLFRRIFATRSGFRLAGKCSRGGMPIPRLGRIDAFTVVSSTGAPWWITRLAMGDPVRRQIVRGIKPFVCPKARFRMLTLHDMDHMTVARAGAFLDRLDRAFETF